MLPKGCKVLMVLCAAALALCTLCEAQERRSGSSTRRERRPGAEETTAKPAGNTKITMKSGEEFQGNIIRETKAEITLDVGFGEVVLKREDVGKIETIAEPAAEERPEESTVTEVKKEENPQPATGDEYYQKMGFTTLEEYNKKWGVESLVAEGAEIERYGPGSSKAYEWTEPSEAVKAMAEQKKACMFYYYNPSDKRSCYYFEKKFFENPRFEEFKKCFIAVKTDSLSKLDLKGDLKIDDGNRGKTGIRFLDFRGKLIGEIKDLERDEYFRRMAEGCLNINETAKLHEAASKLQKTIDQESPQEQK